MFLTEAWWSDADYLNQKSIKQKFENIVTLSPICGQHILFILPNMYKMIYNHNVQMKHDERNRRI